MPVIIPFVTVTVSVPAVKLPETPGTPLTAKDAKSIDEFDTTPVVAPVLKRQYSMCTL